MRKKNTFEDFKRIYASKKEILKQKFKVKSLEIFGSYARGEQRKNSDLDIIVEFEEPVDLFSFILLENYLSRIFGVKVDLVTKEALKERIKESILKEAVKLWFKSNFLIFRGKQFQGWGIFNPRIFWRRHKNYLGDNKWKLAPIKIIITRNFKSNWWLK